MSPSVSLFAPKRYNDIMAKRQFHPDIEAYRQLGEKRIEAALSRNDVDEQHSLFRKLIQHRVVEGYQNIDSFAEYFPDREKCRVLLADLLACENERSDDDMKRHMEDIMWENPGVEHPFTYLDLEAQRYEFPGDEEDNDSV